MNKKLSLQLFCGLPNGNPGYKILKPVFFVFVSTGNLSFLKVSCQRQQLCLINLFSDNSLKNNYSFYDYNLQISDKNANLCIINAGSLL